MRIRGGVMAMLVLLAIQNVARAQLANITTLLDRMEALSVYPIVPVARTGGNYSRTGYGFEFSFRVGEWTEELPLADRRARCAERNAEHAGSCNPENTADTTLTIASVRRSGAVAETTFTAHVNQLEYTKWQFALAVAGQSTALQRNGIVPAWNLEGRVSEWPVLSGYATYRPARKVSPYVGASFLQGDLSDVRIAQGDSAATVSSSANGGAVSAGVVWEFHGLNLFGEANYTVLRFDTNDWLRPANFPANTALPSRLELSGFTLRIGVQLPLSEQ